MGSKKAKVPAAVTPGENYGDRWSWLIWNDDLLTEIFVLLPAKSVTRCKLVCKHWLSLVSSDRFCHLHTLRCPKLRPSFILDLRTPNPWFFIIDPIMNGEKLMIPYTFSVPKSIIVSSCNGLMLLLHSYFYYPFKSFHVYNPTTKLSRRVRVTNANSHNCYIVAFALAFDPIKSPHYKIVCIRSTFRANSDKIRTYQIEVYDSESRAWKLRLGPFTLPERLMFCAECKGVGVYCNGSIYWEADKKIAYYDIAQYEFKTLSMPDYPPYEQGVVYWASTSCLQEANGRLYKSRCLIKDHKQQSIELFEVKMNDDRSSLWLLRYEETISHYEPNLTFPLRFIKGSYDTETCSVVSYTCGKIIVYSFLDKSYKLLFDLRGQPFNMNFYDERPWVNIYEFIECLAVV